MSLREVLPEKNLVRGGKNQLRKRWPGREENTERKEMERSVPKREPISKLNPTGRGRVGTILKERGKSHSGGK